MSNTVLIIDFGSPYTQKVAQGVRNLNIYSEIYPFNKLPNRLEDYSALILTDYSKALSSKIESTKVFINSNTHIPTLAIGESDSLITEKKDRLLAIKEAEKFQDPEQAQNLLDNFLIQVARLPQDWTPKRFVDNAVKKLKEDLGDNKIVLGLSGGVDSTVTAVLLHQSVGQNLHCIFVNHGLLRKDEFSSVLEQYKDMGLNVKGVDASQRFLNELSGVTDPEQKRKIIGRLFIEVFDEEAQKIKDVSFLAQGTIYPDIIESVSVDGSVAVKSHHNVGGLPEKMNLKIVEPLRSLFKDDVRKVGTELGIKPELIGRHPFPGPGLAIRILGDITAEKVKIVQEADAVFINHLRQEGLYDKVWQAGAILLPINSVGKSGDKRTYERVIALRAVNSKNGMTAEWIPFSPEFLRKVSDDIINTVEGVNRVVYDISSKPPATIEWE